MRSSQLAIGFLTFLLVQTASAAKFQCSIEASMDFKDGRKIPIHALATGDAFMSTSRNSVIQCISAIRAHMTRTEIATDMFTGHVTGFCKSQRTCIDTATGREVDMKWNGEMVEVKRQGEVQNSSPSASSSAQ